MVREACGSGGADDEVREAWPSAASARPKYHIFSHVHEEGLQREAMLGGTAFLNVSYFEELRKSL